MSEFDQLKDAMASLSAPNPTPSRPGEYSGSDGQDGSTLIDVDPTLEAAAKAAPVKPAITAAQRGKVLPGTAAPATQIAEFNPEQPPQQEQAPQPVNARLVFTGVTGAGKSFIAQQLGLRELQIQDPIVDLYARYFTGAPSMDFINTVLIWGEGLVDPKTPVTPARISFVHLMRELFKENWGGLNSVYGERGFWQNLLMARAGELTDACVVTTCTSQELLNELKSRGFSHFHIAASPQTVNNRKRRTGANDGLATAYTQQLIREVSMRPQGQMLPCVWNDTTPAPSPRFLTLESARRVLQQSREAIVTGE